MSALVLKINSLEEIPVVAKQLVDFFISNHVKQIAFYGEMGAGKTTLIRAILENMGVQDAVSSPTFSIINEYFSKAHGKIYHCDFYRLNSPQEAINIGVVDMFEEDAWSFIEWPQKIDNLLPQNFVSLSLSKVENACRLIEIKL
jgi:tRNA threonylcarbamoyladenosine biosynthesis protein TsaE